MDLNFCVRPLDCGMAAPILVFLESKNKEGEGWGSYRSDLSERGPTP